jgi:uncharacterized protein
MDVEIVLTKKVTAKKPILFEGFPGIGLVGTITTSYIAEQRNMELIGYIKSKSFPPIAAIHNGRPMYPARIYQDAKKNVLVLFAEFVIPFDVVYELSKVVIDFAKQNGVSKIISLAGMTSIGTGEIEKSDVYGIATTDAIAEFLHKNNVKVITEGATTGVSGVILAESLSEKIPAMSLLVETSQDVPDPRAAATLVTKLNSMFGLALETKPLMEEADKIEHRMRGIMEQSKILDRKMGAGKKGGPEVMFG